MNSLESQFDDQLNFRQRTAIIRAINLGKIIKDEHPEIVEYYREGRSLSQLVERLGDEYDYLNRNAVSYAIRGHDGSFGIESYQGLIADEREKKDYEET